MKSKWSQSWALVGVGFMFILAVAAQEFGSFPRQFKEANDSPQEREAWFMRGRVAVDGISPAEHMLGAVRHAAAMPRVAARSLFSARTLGFGGGTTGGSWTELGPHPEMDNTGFGNVSGRVTGIALDLRADNTGNAAYVGEAFGGVWRCTAALSSSPSCTPLTDGQPSLAIGAVAVDPSTAGVVYAATGEQNSAIDSYYGVGIMKSTNAGASWSLVSSADTGTHPFLGVAFARIAVDPTNTAIVLAAGGSSSDVGGANTLSNNYYRGIYRSTDGGSTWSLAFQVKDASSPTTGYSCTDIAYDPVNAVYFAAFRGHGIYRSADHGATWTQLSTPFANGTQPSFGQNGNFYKVSLATRTGTLYALIADQSGTPSAPTACTQGVTACDTGLVQSTNASTAAALQVTWSPIAVPVCNGLAGCDSSDPLYGGNNQGDYDQFIAAPPGAANLLIGGIDVWSANPNGLSTTWTNLTQAYGPGIVHPDEHAIAVFSPSTFIVGNDGGIYSTTNGAPTVSNWNNGNATLGAIQFISATADPLTNDTVFGGSQDNGTSKSPGTGGPGLWNQIWSGDGGYTAADVSSGNARYFTENAEISLQRSNNAGGSFSAVVSPSTIGDFSSFYVPYQLLPASSGPAQQIVLGTCRIWIGPAAPATAGANWSAISQDLTWGGSTGTCATNGFYIQSVAVAPGAPQTVYVGTVDGRLWKTTDVTDASPNWTELTSLSAPQPTGGTIPVPWGGIAVQPVNSAVVYVGRMGFLGSSSGHVYKTIDGGSTFTDISGNLADSPVNAIAIDPQHPSNVYVAQDVGVFVATDGGVSGEVWQQLGANLPASAVMTLGFAPSTWSTSTLIAATHGRGAWMTAPLATGTQVSGFAFAGNPQTQSVMAGATASYTVTISSTGGFSGTVNLSCSGAPTAANCGVNPSSVSITPSTNSMTTLTVTTTAHSQAPPVSPSVPASPNLLLVFAGLAFSFFALLIARMRIGFAGFGTRSARAAFACAFVAAVLFASAACGKNTTNNNTGGTPAGTYTITVSGASGTTTGQGTVALTVQ